MGDVEVAAAEEAEATSVEEMVVVDSIVVGVAMIVDSIDATVAEETIDETIMGAEAEAAVVVHVE